MPWGGGGGSSPVANISLFNWEGEPALSGMTITWLPWRRDAHVRGQRGLGGSFHQESVRSP